VTEVDLHTGRQTSFTVDGFDVTPGYTRPQGKAVLLVKDDDVDSPAALRRVDLAGMPQQTYPVDKLASEFNAAYLSNPDGTQLVLGTKSGLALMGNDGSVGKPLPIAAAGSCQPTRWFDADSTVALAACFGPDAGSRLWLVPIDGSAPTALTASIKEQTSGDLGDADAWRLPKATYVQASGACGHLYLATLNPDGTTTPVSVPNVDEDSSVVVLGANGNHLNLQARVSCGTGQSLLDYDTETNTSTVLLGPPVNGGGVVYARPYPGTK
jgi:TolB protein